MHSGTWRGNYAEILVHESVEEVSDQNVGDAGIDIIIHRKWEDPARGIPCYFGQCTAQQETWPSKKFEASALNLERYFSFFHKPGNILFIPLCYRGVDGKWLSSVGHQTILVDRKRLIELIEARSRRWRRSRLGFQPNTQAICGRLLSQSVGHSVFSRAS